MGPRSGWLAVALIVTTVSPAIPNAGEAEIAVICGLWLVGVGVVGLPVPPEPPPPLPHPGRLTTIVAPSANSRSDGQKRSLSTGLIAHSPPVSSGARV